MRYGIFLKLEKKYEKPIQNLKKIIFQKKVGKVAYFDHKTHLTLYCFNTNSRLKTIKKTFLNEINKKNKIEIYIRSKKVFYNDPLVKLDTLVYEINKSKELIKIQKKIFETFKKFISKNKNEEFSNKLLNYNMNKYGYPFYGKIWIPHITLGSVELKKNKEIYKLFKNTKIKKKMFVCKITLNKIFKNGNFQKIESK